MRNERRSNHDAVIARVTVADPAGQRYILNPERRFYDKADQPGQSASEVAIRLGLGTDVYLNLAGWDADGKSCTFQIILNPLINFIWIGGILMTLGGLICLLPQRLLREVPADAADEASSPAPQANSAKNNRSTRAVPQGGA
jgi:cytochrome c-type biogenesis protein CcmF